jgi:hypothetical protein
MVHGHQCGDPAGGAGRARRRDNGPPAAPDDDGAGGDRSARIGRGGVLVDRHRLTGRGRLVDQQAASTTVASAVSVIVGGLTTVGAARRLEEDGANVLPGQPRLPL